MTLDRALDQRELEIGCRRAVEMDHQRQRRIAWQLPGTRDDVFVGLRVEVTYMEGRRVYGVEQLFDQRHVHLDPFPRRARMCWVMNHASSIRPQRMQGQRPRPCSSSASFIRQFKFDVTLGAIGCLRGRGLQMRWVDALALLQDTRQAGAVLKTALQCHFGHAQAGKGGMGPETAAGCQEGKAVHAIFPGGCAVLAATQVEAIEGAEWQDLGMPETLWINRVKEFGPLIISIDTKGQNLIAKNKTVFNKKKPILERINQQVRFIK